MYLEVHLLNDTNLSQSQVQYTKLLVNESLQKKVTYRTMPHNSYEYEFNISVSLYIFWAI